MCSADIYQIFSDDRHMGGDDYPDFALRSLKGRCYGNQLFSPLGKLAERAIYFTIRNFSFFSFLSSFLMISRRQIISRSAGPIFANFTSNESFFFGGGGGQKMNIDRYGYYRHPLAIHNESENRQRR